MGDYSGSNQELRSMKKFLVEGRREREKKFVTVAMPVTWCGGKVLAHSANAIATSKALLMMESNLIKRKKSDRSRRMVSILRQVFQNNQAIIKK